MFIQQSAHAAPKATPPADKTSTQPAADKKNEIAKVNPDFLPYKTGNLTFYYEDVVKPYVFYIKQYDNPEDHADSENTILYNGNEISLNKK